MQISKMVGNDDIEDIVQKRRKHVGKKQKNDTQNIIIESEIPVA